MTGIADKSEQSAPSQPQPPAACTAAIAALLSRPDAYPHPCAEVQVIETHASLVFLAGDFVYKLKKPVRYEFLDFSTPELRHAACQAEVRLNRRMAPRTYLGVLPVTLQAAGQVALSGDGPAVDWLVLMRRLPHERTLDELIRTRRLIPADVQKLAEMLGRFYAHAPPLATSAANYRGQIEHHVRANFDELRAPAHGLPRAAVQRVHGAQLRLLLLAGWLFDRRVAAGRIIDGHGDLRPEHICLEDSPVVFDCVEFNDEFRHLDVADELAFLAMECDLLGAAELEQTILREYAVRSGDQVPPRLMAFYKSYRACVRAKVAALRSDQHAARARQRDLAEARRYLTAADAHAAAIGLPLLIVVRGLTGSGKSTLARAIAQQLAAELLQTDQVRRELFPASSQPAADFNAGIYRPELRQAVYDEMFRGAEALLRERISVILDGTFLSAALRRDAAALAAREQALFLLAECQCPDDVARQRIARRLAAGGDVSDARPEFFDLQRREEEPEASLQPLVVDTTAVLQEQVRFVLERLAELWNGELARDHPPAASR
jgi:aminoglycoside phosphotransferase family enzyme/predicted kinase